MKYIGIAQVTVSILLVMSVLLQNRGTGLSAAFGGVSGGYYVKRGVEKFLFWASSVLGALFLILSLTVFLKSV